MTTGYAQIHPHFSPEVIDLVAQIIAKNDGVSDAMSVALCTWCLTSALFGVSNEDMAGMTAQMMPLARTVADQLDDQAQAQILNLKEPLK